MTAWTVGSAIGAYLPNADHLIVCATREQAIEILKDEMETAARASEQDYVEWDTDDPASYEADFEAIWAADGPAAPQIKAGGEIHLRMEDSMGHHWAYWTVPSPEKWFNFGEYDDEPRTPEKALEEWIETFEPPTEPEGFIELLMSETRFDQGAEFNICAIATAATYHAIDLDALGYPLPTEI